MKRLAFSLITAAFLLITVLPAHSAPIRPTDPRNLPLYMDTYKNYIFVFVHGMGSSEHCWNGEDEDSDPDGEMNLLNAVRNMLGGDMREEMSMRIYSSTFDDPYAGYHENAPQLGDRLRLGDNCWLERAKDRFIAKFTNYYGRAPRSNEIPKKFILISHSMGSLAVRSYIYSDAIAASGVDPVNFPYGFYQNDVKKVIFFAPTHKGSAMAEFLLNYVASSEGYEGSVSEPLNTIIKDFDLKNDTFSSAWDKVQNVAKQKVEQQIEELRRKIEAQVSIDPSVVVMSASDVAGLGTMLMSVQVPRDKLKAFMMEIAHIYLKRDTGLITADEAERQLAEVRARLIAYIKSGPIAYGNSGTLGKSSAIKNPWLQERFAESYAFTCTELAANIYEEATGQRDQGAIQRIIADIMTQNASLMTFADMVNYNSIVQQGSSDPQLKRTIDQAVQQHTGFKNYEALKTYIDNFCLDTELRIALEDELKKRTTFTSWSDFETHYQTFLKAQTVTEAMAMSTIIPDPTLKTWPQILARVNVVILDEQPKIVKMPPELEQQVNQWVQEHTDFKTWQELCVFLNSLDLNTALKDELNLQIQKYTEYSSWEEMQAALVKLATVVNQMAATIRDVFTNTNGQYDMWAELNDYLKTISLKVVMKKELDEFAQKYTNFGAWDELEAYLNSVDIEAELKKAFVRIQEKMESEGYEFLVDINVGEDWPLDKAPQVKVHWEQWTQVSLEMAMSAQDMNEMVSNYELSIRMEDGSEFKLKVSDVQKAYERISMLVSPMFRFLQVLNDIGSLPPFTATPMLLIEANSFLAADESKELLDIILTKVAFKQVLEHGAVMSLLPSDPVTNIMNQSDLPALYEPIEYANIVARGSVAFDKRETEEFNQFFYGDLPALKGALTEVAAFCSWGFMPTILANAYQIKLITSPKWQRLPSAESKLFSVFMSYGRGLFTVEGDGAVNIDSLRGEGIPHLAGARQYERMFTNEPINEYLDKGVWEDAVKVDVALLIVQIFVQLPTPVVGAVRCVPLFTLVSTVVNNKEEFLEDFQCHTAILKNKYSERFMLNAIFDDPLVMFEGVYCVSGDIKERLPVSQYQAQTDPDQIVGSAPVIEANGVLYNPMAFNVSKPFITVEGLVKDFAPHKCSLSYSYNFAPPISLTADKDGRFKIENLRVAEGQNILAVEVSNMVGRSRSQFIRIIRSSSPLLPSNMEPMQDDKVGTSSVTVKMDFYNAQFISNNIEASDLETFRIDGADVNKNQVQVTRGSINNYCNRLHVEYPASLNEGLHNIEISATDTYGHHIFGRWTFWVDLTAPTVTINAIPDFCPSSENREIQIFYSLGDNISLRLKNLTMKVVDAASRDITIISIPEAQNVGPRSAYWDGMVQGKLIADGTYTLIISGTDEAGNRVEACQTLRVDTKAPTISKLELSTDEFSTKYGSLTIRAAVDELGNVSSNIVRMRNIDRNVIYTFTMDFRNELSGGLYQGSCVLGFNNGDFILPDGRYEVWLVAADSAGNSSTSDSKTLIVDTTPPSIFRNYAQPLVLSKDTQPPYSTTCYYEVVDESSLTTNAQPIRSMDISAKVISRATGKTITEFNSLPAGTGLQSFSWQAGTSALQNGVYCVRLKVADIHGNIAFAEAEIIKDGIQPIVSQPLSGTSLHGTVAFSGTVSDADWTNTKEFDSYAVYYTPGRVTLPDDLQHLGSEWQKTGIEVPLLNRKYGQSELNVSYKSVQDGILAFWKTDGLTDGEYTLLVVSREKDLGATGGTVRTYTVDNTSTTTYLTPCAYLTSGPVSVDFKTQPQATFQFMNTNKAANINVAILDRTGQICLNKYFPNILGALHYGKPIYTSGGEKGLFLWEDNSGWHLRLNSSAVSFNYSGYIAGVSAVSATQSVTKLPYTVEGNIVRFSGNMPQGKEYGFDFTLQQGSALFFDIDLGEGGTMENAKKIMLGRGRSNPPAAQYALSFNSTSDQAYFTLPWDGKKDTGGYVDNGEYTIKVTAAGADGFGYSSTETTVNVETPFTFKAGAITPADRTFGAFSPIDSINGAYTIDKDAFINAYVRYAGTSQKVSDLLIYKKIPANANTQAISWNGAYPLSDSTQRKVDGDYDMVIEALPCDGSSATQSYIFNNIHIRSSASTINAALSPIGTETAANGNLVRAAEGSTDYYAAARAEGNFYNPSNFSYRVEAKGEQYVSVNPYVPFALLYHRGFNELKLKFSVGATGAGNSVFSGSFRRVYWSADSDVVTFKKGTPSVTFSGSVSNTYIDGFNFDTCAITSLYIQDQYGNNLLAQDDLLGKGWPWQGERTVFRGAFKITWKITQKGTAGDGVVGILSVTMTLLDDVAYSRLTNRYFAWYGWVNGSSIRSLDFSQLFKDHCKLGFPGTRYFSDSNYYNTEYVYLNHYFNFGVNGNYHIKLGLIKLADIKNGPVTYTGEWSPKININNSSTPNNAQLTIQSVRDEIIANHCFGFPGINDQIDPSNNIFSCSVRFEKNEGTDYGPPDAYGRRILYYFIQWRPVITIKAIDQQKLDSLTNEKAFTLDITEKFDFCKVSMNSLALQDKIVSFNNFVKKYADYGSFIKYDDSYANYLSDEYTDIIYIVPTGGAYQLYSDEICGGITRNARLIDSVAVRSKYSKQKTINWPANIDDITEITNQQINIINQWTSLDQIFSKLDLTNLPYSFEINSMDFGGLNRNWFIFNGAISNGRKLYTSKPIQTMMRDFHTTENGLADLINYGLPPCVIPNTVQLEIKQISDPGIDLYFEGSNRSKTFSLNNNGQVRVIGEYTRSPSSNTIRSWTSEMDTQLKDGLVRVGPLTFNQNGFAPISDWKYIADGYNYAGQKDDPVTNYLFLNNEYGCTTSAHVTNPNLELKKLDIALYDQTGAVNRDLELAETNVSDQNILDNKFKVKLKFDAVEKRYVEILGSVAGPYEVMFYNGSAWETIAAVTENAARMNSRLAFWDVGRLNGKYTVAVKVYENTFGSTKFNVSTQEVFIGKLLPKQATSDVTVYSPYKRASVRFAPGSFKEDKFITVTPVNLSKLNLNNPPDISSIGPIVEILPHGSTFDAQHKPTLVFNYSDDDMIELQKRGVNPADLRIYYVNETGELEAASSVFSYVTGNNLYQFTAPLSHFSPYTMLEGDIPALPTVFAANSVAQTNSIRLFGSARPNSVLRIYVDDDSVLEDKDQTKLVKQTTYSTNTAEWALNDRSYNDDFTKKLAAETKQQVVQERAQQPVVMDAAIASNNQLMNTWKKTELLAVATSENKVIQEVRTDLQDTVATASIYTMPAYGKADMSAIQTKSIDPALSPALRACRDKLVTAPALIMPDYKRCLPPTATPVEIVNYLESVEQAGLPCTYYEVTTDADGYYKMDVQLMNVPSNTVFVTYKKTDRIKNRPVARFSMGLDPNAPKLSRCNASRAYVNRANKAVPVTLNIAISETGKVGVTCFNIKGKALSSWQNTLNANTACEFKIETADLADGRYLYSVSAIDAAGNTSLPQVIELLVDTVAPTGSLSAPKAFNPNKRPLRIAYNGADPVTVAVTIRDSSGNMLYQKETSRENLCSEFSPRRVSADFINTSYNYETRLIDEAGNVTIVTGNFLVDTIPPKTPAEVNGLGKQNMAYMFWQGIASDNVTYIVTRKNKERRISENVINGPGCTFSDKNVSADAFYYYTVAAQDDAENISTASRQVIVYTADNTVQKMCGSAESISLNYLGFTVTVPTGAVAEDNLIVMNLRQNNGALPAPRYQGNALIGNACRLLASERSSFTAPITVELSYAGLQLPNGYLSDTMRVAYWDGHDWTTFGLTDTVIDTVNMVVRARTSHFTDFAILGDIDAHTFDANGPKITFDSLRNSDYLDVSTTISLTVLEQTTPINTATMRLILDGHTYNISPNLFVEDPGVFNGKLYLNLNAITGGVGGGNHTLIVQLADSAGNTGNAQVSFTYETNFVIKDVINVPNPFEEDGTHFTYQLSLPANKISIKIYDTNGRLIQELENCPKGIGFNKVFWDGKDRWGEFVANDVYLYVVICEDPDGEKIVIKGKVVAMR